MNVDFFRNKNSISVVELVNSVQSCLFQQTQT